MAIYKLLLDLEYPALGTCTVDDAANALGHSCRGGTGRKNTCGRSPKFSLALATAKHYYCTQHFPEKYQKQIQLLKQGPLLGRA